MKKTLILGLLVSLAGILAMHTVNGQINIADSHEKIKFKSGDNSLLHSDIILNLAIIPIEDFPGITGSPMRHIDFEKGEFICCFEGPAPDRKSNTIYRFRLDGKFLNTIETGDINNFMYADEDMVYVFHDDMYMSLYNTDGQLISRQTLPVPFHQASIHDGNSFCLYTPPPPGVESGSLITFIDPELTIEAEYIMDLKSITDSRETRPVMITDRNKLYVHENGNNTIYVIEEGSIGQFLEIDFGKYSIPRKLLEGKEPARSKKLNDFFENNDHSFIRHFMINEEYIIVQTAIQRHTKGDGGIEYNLGIKNNFSGQWEWFGSHGSGVGLDYAMTAGCLIMSPGREIICVVESETIEEDIRSGKYDYFGQLTDQLPRYSLIVYQLDYADNEPYGDM